MHGLADEHYIEGENYQLRSHRDRRFWHTSGVRQAIHFGIVDDYGIIVRTWARPCLT